MLQKSTADPGSGTLGCIVTALRGILGLAMIAGLVDCFFLFAVQFFRPLSEAAGQVHNPLRPLMDLIHDGVVRDVAGIDVAPAVAAVLIVLCRQVIDSMLAPEPSEAAKDARKGSAGASSAAQLRSAPSAPLAPRPAVGSSAPAVGSSAPVFGMAKRNRMEILREISQLKKQIETRTAEDLKAAQTRVKELQAELVAADQKTLAFMAIDVVGSTKMKAGQKSAIVEHAFLAFREWVDGIMKQHGVWKSSWTPDGVMAAFTDLDGAAGAAKDVLSGLAHFNKEGHSMDVPLQIRVGVSYGTLIFSDESRMDEVSDQTIDLAGHLQKYAQPNTLLMAKRDHDRLRDKKGFRGSHQRVDGFDTLEWMA